MATSIFAMIAVGSCVGMVWYMSKKLGVTPARVLFPEGIPGVPGLQPMPALRGPEPMRAIKGSGALQALEYDEYAEDYAEPIPSIEHQPSPPPSPPQAACRRRHAAAVQMELAGALRKVDQLRSELAELGGDC